MAQQNDLKLVPITSSEPLPRRGLEDGAVNVGPSSVPASSETRTWNIVSGDAQLGYALLYGIHWTARSALASVVVPALVALDNPSETINESPMISGISAVTAAVESLAELAFDELNLHRVEIHLPASSPYQKVMQQQSFDLEGTLRRHLFVGGQYVDVHVYSKLATDVVPD